MSYEDRLSLLNWSTFSSRRNFLFCSFSFKCLHGFTEIKSLSSNIQISAWNALPSDVKDAAILNSLPSFLSLLKQSLLNTG